MSEYLDDEIVAELSEMRDEQLYVLLQLIGQSLREHMDDFEMELLHGR